MKYKRIKSFLHNYGHSFFSLMNYVDGHYIVDIIGEMLNKAQPHEIIISFPEGHIEPKLDYPTALRESISHWVAHMGKHATSEGVDIEKVKSIKLVARGTRMGVEYFVRAVDDRGKTYDISIQNAA